MQCTAATPPPVVVMPSHDGEPVMLEPALKLRLIGKSNGVGLSRDLELLAAALRACGCEVTQQLCERRERKRRRSLRTRLAMRFSRWQRTATPPPFDVNVMLERVWPKTAFAEQLFVARGCRVLRIGFDSEDRWQAAVPRQPQFLHLAGRSPLKGTQRLLAL